MEFLILGPLEVRGPKGAVAIPGARLQALLAVFLLNANEPVTPERLAGAMFGDEAPAAAVSTVRVHVSRLRRALGADSDLLTTSAAGYRLRVLPGELDSERFAALVERGRVLLGSDPERAASVLRDALGLWRGPALAEVAFESFAQAAIARLEEQRLGALELRIEADLAAGRADEVVAELQGLAEQYTLRERVHAQLMLALYRCGRQAEALDAYRRLRTAFVEERGIEPSSELRELEGAILRHDPSLGGQRRPRRPPVRHVSRRVGALLALGTVAGVVTGMVALGGPDRRRASKAETPDAALRVPRFETSVGEVCEDFNAASRVQRRETATLRRKLHSAGSTMGQRKAILVATRATIDRDGHNLAHLRSLEPPSASRDEFAATVRAWDANLDYLRRYAVRLDRATNRPQLLQAIAPLTTARPAIERNSVTVKAGLQRLGAPQCRIELYVENPVLLPAPRSGSQEVATTTTAAPQVSAPLAQMRPPTTSTSQGTPPKSRDMPDASPPMPTPAPDVGVGSGGGDD